MARFVALTPTYRPVGGVIKIFSYVRHALALGLDVEVHCPEPIDDTSVLFRNPAMGGVADRVTFYRGLEFDVDANDYVFFSWPMHYSKIIRQVSRVLDLSRIIHLIQGIRHSNPLWLNGYARRLLSVPMTRIMISEHVLKATRPLVSQSSVARLIRQGHDSRFFHLERTGGFHRPVRVAYTAWKSTIGDRVVAQLQNDERFEFAKLQGDVDWMTLRSLYHWSDVFLACPRPQEGFYLPGLEAFAAGSILITPDVGGNMAYCRFDVNCVKVGYGSNQEYVSALGALASSSAARIESLRQSAYAIVPEFDPAAERDQFEALLEEIDRPLDASECADSCN